VRKSVELTSAGSDKRIRILHERSHQLTFPRQQPDEYEQSPEDRRMSRKWHRRHPRKPSS
jgi:hypothetical protein